MDQEVIDTHALALALWHELRAGAWFGEEHEALIRDRAYLAFKANDPYRQAEADRAMRAEHNLRNVTHR